MLANLKSLEDLIQKCREQTELYSQREPYDPAACYEIWRRAIVQRDEDAWSALIEQYSSFVRKWLQQRIGTVNALRNEEEMLFNGVFINLYRFLTPDKFNSFSGLPALLQYLKMCCWTIVADAQRDLQARKMTVPLDSVLPPDESGNSTPGGSNPADRLSSNFELEESVLAKVDRTAFWQEVWDLLESPVDRKLVYLRYVLHIPPREIVQLYPGDFSSVDEVYRRTKNLCWRLKNSRRF